MTPTERKQQIKTLWRQCFDDTQEFVDFYFDNVYKDENALTLERDGQVVSALQMVPYAMTWCGTEVTVAYISGACTAPEERGKGLMGELLHNSFSEMRRKDYDLTALIPANASLFEYYRTFGYTEAFDYSLLTYVCPEQAKQPGMQFVSLDPVPGGQWFAYFDRKMRERSACILHSEEDFRNNITDTVMDQGLVLGASDAQGHPVGIAFATATEQETFVKEMLCDSEQIRCDLLQKAAGSFHTSRVIYKAPPLLSTASRYGMAMILNKEKMIWQWLGFYPDTPLSAEELNQMDIQALTRNLLGYGQKEAYMSLMMD